jgi:AcrR family transcriptional regulator
MATTTHREADPVREELVEAALRLLASDGAEALVLRRVASAARVSTMCVYSRFGDKLGLLHAVHAGGVERLADVMSEAGGASDPTRRLIDLGVAYRRFAMSNPALYTLMYERMVGFTPSAQQRATVMEKTLSPLGQAMGEAADLGMIVADDEKTAAYNFWAAAHGAVSLELAGQTGGPDAEESYRGVLDNTLRGMRSAGEMPPVGGR